MPKPRVLVIEDDPVWAGLLGDCLGGHYSVARAADGAAGLAAAAAKPPDAVVLDLHMPGMDGATVLTRLRALPSARMTPVVIFSSSADRALHQRLAALAAPGGFAVVSKSARMDKLLTTLRTLVGS